MHLRLLRVLDEQLVEDSFGDALRRRPLEHAFAAEAVALDTPEARRHQLIGTPVVLERLLALALLVEAHREPRLDAVRVGEIFERLAVPRKGALIQAQLVELVGTLGDPDRRDRLAILGIGLLSPRPL